MRFENREGALEELQEALDQTKEDLFLARTDLESSRNENIVMKNFLQNLYESCGSMEEVELSLAEVLENLRENIRRFSKANNIRL